VTKIQACLGKERKFVDLVTHQKNIERLLKGKESRVNLFKRKE
jgi:glycerol-3-phosphate acyltransferase PlsY